MNFSVLELADGLAARLPSRLGPPSSWRLQAEGRPGFSSSEGRGPSHPSASLAFGLRAPLPEDVPLVEPAHPAGDLGKGLEEVGAGPASFQPGRHFTANEDATRRLPLIFDRARTFAHDTPGGRD